MNYTIRNNGDTFKLRLGNTPVKLSELKDLKAIKIFIPRNWEEYDIEDAEFWLTSKLNNLSITWVKRRITK